MGVSCIVDSIAGKIGLVGEQNVTNRMGVRINPTAQFQRATHVRRSWRCTELATTVTGSEPIRLPCVGSHESYGVCTQGEHERRTIPTNSQHCKKHQQRCSAS